MTRLHLQRLSPENALPVPKPPEAKAVIPTGRTQRKQAISRRCRTQSFWSSVSGSCSEEGRRLSEKGDFLIPASRRAA